MFNQYTHFYRIREEGGSAAAVLFTIQGKAMFPRTHFARR